MSMLEVGEVFMRRGGRKIKMPCRGRQRQPPEGGPTIDPSSESQPPGAGFKVIRRSIMEKS